jgi:6-phosphogluconate dehydrogenase (decarboxylating)
MSNYIENNKNTWFTLNEEIKKNGDTPMQNTKPSLLQRADKKQPDEMMNTKRYMMTIRNAFKRHMEQQEGNA